VEVIKVFTLLILLDENIILILNDLFAFKACQRWQISATLSRAEFATYPDDVAFFRTRLNAPYHGTFRELI